MSNFPDDSERDRVEPVMFHVRSALIDHEGYCPIATSFGYRQKDGTIVDGNSNRIIQPKDVLETPGFLVVQLGSIERDHTLETASQALHHSLKSLFAACDIPVDFERMRTTVELSEFMKTYRENYSHVILMGHGAPEGILFLDKPKPIAGSELSGYLGADQSCKSIQIVSLCCHSGCEPLARALSSAPNVSEVLAPNAEFDIRWAVHFVTGFLLAMYITGMNVDDAVRAAAAASGHAPMCIWRSGSLVHNCMAHCK